MTRPLLIIEASGQAFSHAIAEVARTNARIVDGWQHDSAVVCAGTVRDAADAAEALLAVIAGAGLIIHVQCDRAIIDRLVDDLRRFGRVDHRTAEPPDGPALTSDERRLLDVLAQGRRLDDAAADLHLSRRTVDRRLAAARRKLGVATTAEAIVNYGRSGACERGGRSPGV